MFQEEGNLESLTCRLNQICLTYDLADVFFSFEGENVSHFPAHRMILALRSPVFKAMFYGSFPQSEGDIRIDDISLNTFKELMK